jgi:hypothetical protein
MEECRRLQGMACQISMAFLLYFVGLTIYAARRRTELHERFNIAGAALGCSRHVTLPCFPCCSCFARAPLLGQIEKRVDVSGPLCTSTLLVNAKQMEDGRFHSRHQIGSHVHVSESADSIEAHHNARYVLYQVCTNAEQRW